MSTEDRVRAATRARTDLIRHIRPLELPDELPARGRRSRRAHRARPAHSTRSARHWFNWGAPLAAAALVTALALVLVQLRQAPPPRSGPATPTSAPSGTASVPRYYAMLSYGGGVLVADDRTGRTVANVPPPAGQDFTGVTAAADDRTFVLSGIDNGNAETTWHLLRIIPGTAHPARLTQLPVKPLRSQIHGLALSQDGRELAVMLDGPSGLQLSTYSVSSGALLGSWQTDTVYWGLRTAGDNAYGLSWLADGRHVAFRFDAYAKDSVTHLVTVRTLDVTAAGHDLLADSRLDLQVPLAADSCFSSLAAPDGRSVICAAAGATGQGATGQGKTGCSGTLSSLVSYSTATGQRLRVLYHNPRPCQAMVALPLWTDASASQVIGLVLSVGAGSGPRTVAAGLIVAGHFTPFPGPSLSPLILDKLGVIAF